MTDMRERDAVDEKVDLWEGRILRWIPRVIAVIALVAIGWLYLSPPALRLEATDDTIACRPLGFELPGDVDLYTRSAEREATVEEYLRETGPWSETDGGLDDDEVHARNAAGLEASLAETGQLCADARENRQTTLFLATGALLALLVWRTRRTPAASGIRSA